MNPLCELAKTGIEKTSIAPLIAVAIILFTLSILLGRRFKFKGSLFSIAVLFFAVIFIPVPQVFAAESCSEATPSESSSDDAPENTSNARLVDDIRTASTEEYYQQIADHGGYETTIQISDNDQASPDDPIDLDTVRLTGGYPYPGEMPGTFMLVFATGDTEPNDDQSNEWGYWWIDLDCTDYDDFDTCLPADPKGTVGLAVHAQTPAGTTISIQYTARTMSGKALAPATISFTVPEAPPTPANITAIDVADIYYGYNGHCTENSAAVLRFENTLPPAPWNDNWTLDIMNLAETDGTSPLLPSTIDLDPNTPGVQSSISYTYISGHTTTFTVDSGGVVAMTSLNPALETTLNWPEIGFSYTISDADGETSNVAIGLALNLKPNCDQS